MELGQPSPGGRPGPGNLASAGCGPASSRGHAHDTDESQRSRWGVAHPRRRASASDSRPIHDRLRLSKTASPARNIRLTRIPPPSLQSPRYAHLNSERPELSPLSAGSRASSDASDWIGSGTDTVGGRTPVVDRRLSFIPADSDYAESDGDGDDRSPRRPYHRHHAVNSGDEDDDDDDDLDPDHNDKMAPPSYNRGDSHSGAPLLNAGDDDRGRARYNHSRTPSPSAANDRARPHLSRRSTMRSQSPDNQAKMAAKKKYLFASVFLVISLVSFTIQTELAAYVQNEMGWNKAYCMLYMTHGSWALLWPVQLLILRLQKWNMPFKTFWRRHVYVLRSTAHMVRSQELDVPKQEMATSPLPYLIKTTAFVTSALTVAGLGWYIAVNMTTPSDLTAIYNCSAFFAYAFSVPILKEKLRLDKSIAVGIAIFGVLVVAYGDSRPGEEDGSGKSAGRRFLGNLIIGVGSVLYGLYEVLYKRYACPPEGVSPGRGMIFANAFGSCIGFFTLTVLWLPLPVLHMLGWETFELPTGETALWLWLSVVMNATFAGSFLVLISLTSPVLSSVASLLTIFIVAITDWLRTGKAISLAALAGGIMIIVAFLMLSWSTWREMTEDAREKAAHHALEQEWDSEDESDKEVDRRT